MARKNTNKPTSLLVVLKGRKPLTQSSFLDFLTCYANVAVFNSTDLRPNILPDGFFNCSTSLLHEFVSNIDSPINTLNVISADGKPKDLDLILDEIESKLTDSPTIHLSNFKLTGRQFRRLLSIFDDVSLERCSLGRGWWLAATSPKCTSLHLSSCSGAVFTSPKIGQTKLTTCKSLGIFGADVPFSLRRTGLHEDSGLDTVQIEAFARIAATVFWNSEIASISLYRLENIDFVPTLPVPISLKYICFDSPVTVEVFDWIVQNKRLSFLGMNWTSDTVLPFKKIKSLRGLRAMQLESSPLKDAELLAIAESCKLTGISAYYTELTSKSLPVILKWPSLKSFWGSQHMVGQVDPTELPETTNLKEFVALNARAEWFRQFFKNYPNVSVEQM